MRFLWVLLVAAPLFRLLTFAVRQGRVRHMNKKTLADVAREEGIECEDCVKEAMYDLGRPCYFQPDEVVLNYDGVVDARWSLHKYWNENHGDDK